jgi:hypothetical protein
VSVYNLPRVERIRRMRAETIGRLVSFSGTVTRSSEVRPELLFGSFICRKCGTVQTGIEQQCAYSEPQICINPNNCPSRDFQVLMDQCVFVDWQRLRVQENADEIPAGSMPRCIDVICRYSTCLVGFSAMRCMCMPYMPYHAMTCHDKYPISSPTHPTILLTQERCGGVRQGRGQSGIQRLRRRAA